MLPVAMDVADPFSADAVTSNGEVGFAPANPAATIEMNPAPPPVLIEIAWDAPTCVGTPQNICTTGVAFGVMAVQPFDWPPTRSLIVTVPPALQRTATMMISEPVLLVSVTVVALTAML